MKICLVLSPALYKRCPLIGLAYLAANLKDKGHEVKIVDLNAEFNCPQSDNEQFWNNKESVEKFLSENNTLIESFVQKILNCDSKIIGFSIWASTKYVSLALAEAIKQKDKDKVIVFGGPECSFNEDLIRNEAVDLVVLGEGEETLTQVLSLYENNTRIDFCPGTLLRNNGNIINCGYRTEIEDLDKLSFPDYSQFDLYKYHAFHLPMQFYRGCIRNCVFCNTSVIWKKFRSRSAESIFKEMTYQLSKFPMLKKFEIDDTALNLNLSMVSKLCDLIIANGLKIRWGGSAIILKEMDASILRKMAKSGCNCIGYGFESGSQKIIDGMRKGFKIKDAERVVRDTYSAGIETILGIIIGFPGETEDDFRETLRFIERNKSYISWIHAPSECNACSYNHIYNYPDNFNVILAPNGDGELWRSKDGTNTHEERQRRIKIFNEFLSSINVKSSHYAKVSCKG